MVLLMLKIMDKKWMIIVLTAGIFLSQEDAWAQASTLRIIDEHTRAGEKNYLTGYPPFNSDGTVNMVVEIPAGTNEKWEVKKSSENPEGFLRRDFQDGKPRVVKYLSYPFNYGMVPNTVLSEVKGGDGDPLDIIALGPAQAQGIVLPLRVIGSIRLLDKGRQDDKLIAVLPNSPFDEVKTLEDLNQYFPGVTSILETFFRNYKGPGKMVFLGFGNLKEARDLLDSSIFYASKESSETTSSPV